MTSRANLTRLALSLCGLAGFGFCTCVMAQVAEPGATAYQDHYIGGGLTTPDISSGEGTTSDTSGLSRTLQVDGVASVLSSQASGNTHNVVEDGIVVKSQWETASYGAWSLDAAARTGGSGSGQSDQGQGGVVTLRQRGMNFDGGWQAENGLGDLNSPDIALAQIQPRFYLPTSAVQGVETEWHGPSGLQIVAGGGVPGIYDGIVAPDFRTLGGSTATAGAQYSPSSHWTVGGQVIEARDVNLAIGPVIDGTTSFSSTTGLVTAAWQDANEHVQLNLVDGNVSSNGFDTGNGFGAWVDGSITQGRFQQNAGLFRIDPNLTWGNQLIANDMQGGYYRLNYQDRQWLADVGLDEVHSVSGLGANTTFVTADTRYQWSRDWGVGGVANLSHTEYGDSWSVEGYVDHSNATGTGRLQADFAKTTIGQDATLILNQSWSTPVGIHFSTAISVDRISDTVLFGPEQDSTVVGLSAYGGGQFTTAFGIEGNARYARAVQGEAATGVSANISLTWQVSPAWQILATYYESRVGSWEQLVVDSPLTPPIATAIPSAEERGVFLTLRYRRASGSHFAPLGGAPGAGSGEISGFVFLDANNNGHQEAGELGAPNVTVVLDGRFSVQTDVNGRFSFPVVATGHHVVTVVSDNLPLPWFLAADGRTPVEVTTRNRSEISIAAQRTR
jgi:SdrD B-like domain